MLAAAVAATSPRSPGGLRTALVSACAALGLSGSTAQAGEVDAAVLGYSEPERVSALETVARLQHTFADGKGASFKLVFDALTGASANGATPASQPQTFTRPSGSGRYETAAGDTPLDDTFRDTRVAASAGYSMPLGRVTIWDLGLYGSTEHDYASLGANTALTRDFNKRNTTLTVRAAYYDDTINPEGGRPVPFAPMAPAGGEQPRRDGEPWEVGVERPGAPEAAALRLRLSTGALAMLHGRAAETFLEAEGVRHWIIR